MKTLMLFVFLAATIAAHAQRGIKLSSRISKRQKFIEEGARVFYQYANNSHPAYVTYTRYGQPVYRGIVGVGMLKIVNDSTIQVDEEVIRTKDLMAFGQRKKGAWVGSFLLYFGGFSLVAASVTTHSEPEPHFEINAPLMTVGVGCVIAGFAGMINRYPKSMNVWRLEVVK